MASGGQLQGAPISAAARSARQTTPVPDIVTKGSGKNVGGFLGSFAGAIVSSINISSSMADVTLAMTNVRTTEQEAMTQVHGSKTDV